MATLEAIIVLAFLAGVFLSCLLLVSWGTGLQSAQMGARLLAFDAGDATLAKLGQPARTATQQFTSQSWDTLVHTTTGSWLRGMFVLSNGDFSGNVAGTARGRVPTQGGSLFQYSSTNMGYYYNGWAGTYSSWGTPESVVRKTFLRIGYYVGLHRTSPSGLDSTCARPLPHGDTVLETMYRLAGAR